MKKHHGYTLIELIVVIAIIGVLAVAVLPSWQGSNMSLLMQAERLLNDLRYAQALSMATGQRYRWVRMTDSSYEIQDASGTAVNLPLGGTQVVFAAGVIFAAFTNLPDNLLVFSELGIPYVTTGAPGTPLASTASIPMTVGAVTATIQITPETGYGVVV